MRAVVSVVSTIEPFASFGITTTTRIGIHLTPFTCQDEVFATARLVINSEFGSEEFFLRI